jgi:hypothetical protein
LPEQREGLLFSLREVRFLISHPICTVRGMSLTSMLGDRHGPLREWFEERLPDLRPMQTAYRAAGTVSLVPSGVIPYGTVGTAFDYRVRYYFAVTPPERFTAAKGAASLPMRMWTMRTSFRRSSPRQTERCPISGSAQPCAI